MERGKERGGKREQSVFFNYETRFPVSMSHQLKAFDDHLKEFLTLPRQMLHAQGSTVSRIGQTGNWFCDSLTLPRMNPLLYSHPRGFFT